MISVKTFLNATFVESSVSRSDCAAGSSGPHVGEESRIGKLGKHALLRLRTRQCLTGLFKIGTKARDKPRGVKPFKLVERMGEVEQVATLVALEEAPAIS
jgi:hypothetical protein